MLLRIGCIVAFLALMAIWGEVWWWILEQIPKGLREALGLVAMGYAVGFLHSRWRALRLIRRHCGPAASDALQGRL